MKIIVHLILLVLIAVIFSGCTAMDCGVSIAFEEGQYVVKDGWCEIKGGQK